MTKSNIAKINLGPTHKQTSKSVLFVLNAAISGGVQTRNKKANETKVQVDNIFCGKKLFFKEKM